MIARSPLPSDTRLVDRPLGAVRRARWLLIVAHVPFVVFAPLSVVHDFDVRGGGHHPLPPILLGVVMAVCQLRHSLAAARGVRPRFWPLTFLVVVLVAYVPLPAYGWDWPTAEWFVFASAIMLLRGPYVPYLVVAAVLVPAVVAAHAQSAYPDAAWHGIAWMFACYVCWEITGPAVLYGSTRLVKMLDELYATRIELAELAVGPERVRVSRDLHDLVGQSLSAVSLKGDLAMQLLHSDVPAARAEIESLTGVARDALRDVRAVAHDEHAVSLRTETDGAGALLGAAGIDARIDVAGASRGLARPVEYVLAWAIREGVTNMLRHSEARTCSITAERWEGTVRLELVNDGARPQGPDGTGLTGLAERAQALSASVSSERTPDGRFRLLVVVPLVPVGAEGAR